MGNPIFNNISSLLNPQNSRLSAAESLKLITDYQATADLKILERLLGNHLNLVFVVIIQRKNKVCQTDLEDWVSEGLIGLIKAIESYNPKRALFSTYACQIIRRRQDSHSAETGQLVRRRILKQDDQIKKIWEELVGRLSRDPTIEEIHERWRSLYSNLRSPPPGKRRIRAAFQTRPRYVSLSHRIPEWSERKVKGRRLDYADYTAPDRRLLAYEELSALRAELRRLTSIVARLKLSERSRHSFLWYYGLSGRTSLSLSETGRLVGVCKQAVSYHLQTIWPRLPSPYRPEWLRDVQVRIEILETYVE